MIHGSWDMEFNRQNFFVILDNFLLFYLPNNPKNKDFEKMKKAPGDIITLHMYHKWQSFDAWFLRYGVWRTQFFCNFRLFFAFLPPNNLKNQNFEKLKKTSGNIAILNKCTKNHYHMLYCSLDIVCNGCNCYFSFWGIFCPFTPLTARKKNKIKKKWKKRLEISFHTSVTKIMITYAILLLRYGVWQM